MKKKKDGGKTQYGRGKKRGDENAEELKRISSRIRNRILLISSRKQAAKSKQHEAISRNASS